MVRRYSGGESPKTPVSPYFTTIFREGVKKNIFLIGIVQTNNFFFFTKRFK